VWTTQCAYRDVLYMLSTPNSDENKNLIANNRESMQKIIYPISQWLPCRDVLGDFQFLKIIMITNGLIKTINN
jgi:hypothetical protein